MNIALFVTGLALVLFILFDALWTALWPEGGAGPLTDRVGGTAWNLAKRLASSEGQIKHKRLSIAGPAIIMLTVVTWLFLLWGGFFLMFSSHPEAVVDATNFEPADASERLWFVLYASSSMGNGDFLPDTSAFQILAGLATNTAIALITLSITYMIQVLTAVVQKRSFAGEVSSLGNSTAEIVESLQRARPSGIASQLSALGSRLGTITEQHKAYPVLHYFHPIERSRSAACAVASLDEALMVYMSGLDEEEADLAASTLAPMQRSIANFLTGLRDNYVGRVEKHPPLPDVDELREHNVDIERREHLEDEAEEHEERRRMLMGLVDYNGWSWDDVLHGAQ